MNKIKSKKQKNKNFDKLQKVEIELGEIKFVNNPNKLQSELKELIKIQVNDKNLHEIKQEMLGDYAGEFETSGKLSIGDQIRETQVRYRNIIEYDSYINSLNEGYDAEDAIFNGYFHKIRNLQFDLVERSQNGSHCDFKHKIIEYHGSDCFVPTKG